MSDQVATVAKSRQAELVTLVRYKAWANKITYATVAALPDGEALRSRPTRFGNIVHTLNHIFVVEDIFRAHLEGRQHGYTSRNTSQPPPLEVLREKVEAMDNWCIEYAKSLAQHDLNELVEFEFVGGGHGTMTRAEILAHLVNHATYHRGFVGDMLYQASVTPPATDLSVYLRDVVRTPAGALA